jgi:Holliday junction resolvase
LASRHFGFGILAPEMDAKQITETAFRLLQHYGEVSKVESLDPETLERLTQRVQRIRAGLAPEKELIAAVNWLSNVVAIHQLDQTPQPAYCKFNEMRIPDLLAIALYEGHLIPILIEVKTTDDDKLIWREDYLQALERYAEAVRMPLLVAWKHQRIWVLTEVRHFAKRVSAYHLDFNTAMRESLMGELFGDLMIKISDNVRFFVDAKVAEELPPDRNVIIPEGGYTLTITAAGFMVDDNIVNLPKELFWAFIASATRDEVIRIGEQEVRIQFLPLPDSIFSLTDLWRLVALFGNKEAEPNWEEITRKPLTLTASKVRQELREGIPKGVVQYVFEVQPNTMPEFLYSLKANASS